MFTELETELLASKLLASEAAALALAEGWRATQDNGPGIVTEVFIETYRLRAAHVAKMQGAHWQQLAASTEEFVQNLRSEVGWPAECITITGPSEHEFVVFRQGLNHRILGCMRAIPRTANDPEAS
jgi:hypothetical protein